MEFRGMVVLHRVSHGDRFDERGDESRRVLQEEELAIHRGVSGRTGAGQSVGGRNEREYSDEQGVGNAEQRYFRH